MPKIHQNIIRQVFTLLLILLLAYFIVLELVPFMSGLLGAVTLYILLKKRMRKMVLNGWNPNLAAGVLLLLSFIGILIPIGITATMLVPKIGNGIEKVQETFQSVKAEIAEYEYKIGFELLSTFDSEKTSQFISDSIENLVGNVFTIFIAISIMYFLLFYMLVNRKKFIESMYTYLPLREENISIIGKEINGIVKSNAIGIPLVALLQGLVALVGFLILDVPNPWFWFVITTVGSMIPFIGTALGVGPVIVLLFLSGDTVNAIIMLVYGVVVVGSTDNLFRLIVQKRLANIHPLITLIGVVIGVPLFGFMGLVFGPLLISLFLLTLRIYKKEYVDTREHE